ncbi:ABC transporter permease [Kitasatospora viridis]|uniref:Transport permease protein n=1 Tax=Kitasatospora viridis TaxID=281105 RepID=A0A561TVN5_9ACTN|nr:ABC transporter permease [Kitasatospora viridis]TWF91173.1 ABC-2 type transport system permease protein [Kitasatospora viridis]
MTTLTEPAEITETARARTEFGPVTRTFLAVLWRDVYTTSRRPTGFLLQVVVQPLLLFFVFGKVLSEAGITRGDFGATLLPGVMALNAVLVALENTAMPLIMDFSWSGEIEDRLLAPLPGSLVAVAKMLFGTLCGLFAGLVMAPIGFLVLGTAGWPLTAWPGLLLILLLGSATGAGAGLMLGTIVSPDRIGVTFSLVMAPLTFTGSVQYPWSSLGHLRWFQVVSAVNPLTYVSEGLRAAALPGPPSSIPLWVDALVLLVALVVTGAVGIKGFMSRALG